jgi:uncharacterized iron-regulated membrane protein
MLRKSLFWLHLCLAVSAGLVILLMSATGLLIAFETQLQGWADRGDRTLTPAPGAQPLSVEQILDAVRIDRPDLTASSVTVRSDPSESLALGLGRDGVLYVDPYRGTITGAGANGLRSFFRVVTELHRYLGARGDGREIGKAATGAANLAFVVVLLSGLYLWIPRVLRRSQFRQNLLFRGGLSAKARDFNWHHVFGIWAALPLLAIVVSALPISYDWAGKLLMRVTGSVERAPEAPRPSAPAAPAAPGPRPEANRAPSTPKLAEIELAGLDAVVARAAAETPGWQSLALRLPPKPNGEWTVIAERAARRGRPDLRSRLVIAANGAAEARLVEEESFAAQSLGRRARGWMRWIHTGEAGGIAGQLVGALACAAALLLGWTGFALSLRRLRAFRARRSAAGASAVEIPLADLDRPVASSHRSLLEE